MAVVLVAPLVVLLRLVLLRLVVAVEDVVEVDEMVVPFSVEDVVRGRRLVVEDVIPFLVETCCESGFGGRTMMTGFL